MAWLNAKDKIVIASHNDGKVVEIARLLKPYHINVVSSKNFNPPLPEIDETGTTFAENAALKARAAAAASGLVALSDDSGLCVEALDNAPGIYSARFATREDGSRDFAFGCEKILHALKSAGARGDNFNAAFMCALALATPQGEVKIFQGKVKGTITAARGNQGFGYDPIFLPVGYDITFGEMAPEQKHKISHRADAFAQLIEVECGAP